MGVGVNRNSFYGAVVFSNQNNAITTPFHKKCKLMKTILAVLKTNLCPFGPELSCRLNNFSTPW